MSCCAPPECKAVIYGQIPKQPKPQKTKQNQGNISKNNNKLRKQRAPKKLLNPFKHN